MGIIPNGFTMASRVVKIFTYSVHSAMVICSGQRKAGAFAAPARNFSDLL
jgi:hypothetical protein